MSTQNIITFVLGLLAGWLLMPLILGMFRRPAA